MGNHKKKCLRISQAEVSLSWPINQDKLEWLPKFIELAKTINLLTRTTLVLLQINREISQYHPVTQKSRKKCIQKMNMLRLQFIMRPRKKFQLTSQLQQKNNQLKKLHKTFTHHSVLEISSNKIQLQETSHQFWMIQLRVDMLVCSSQLLQSENLFAIFEDVAYLSALYKNSDSFSMFTKNTGVGAREIKDFNAALESVADFNPLTMKFLEVLAENKRLSLIGEICTRFIKLYQLLNKEEKITIISAVDLNSSE